MSEYTGKSVFKNANVSPQKARLVIDLIRFKDVERAQQILSFSKKRCAQDILKTLKAAVHNSSHRDSPLYIAQAYADQGTNLKRLRPGSRGKARKIIRRRSHITISVNVQEGK